MKLKAGVLIGRFQPLHNGHLDLIEKVFSFMDSLIIVIGSSNAEKDDERNPYSFEIRKSFFEKIKKKQQQIEILGLDDFHDDVKWTSALENLLTPFTEMYDLFLIGVKKDVETARYLDSINEKTTCFSGKKLEELDYELKIDATRIRDLVKKKDWLLVRDLVPSHVFEILIRE